jgi:queuine tRNA-ribosyltransferase
MLKNSYKQIQKGAHFARSGYLKTRRGKVLTPFFMPVATRGAVKSVEQGQVAATGAQVLLSNTYHLHLQPGEKIIKDIGGLHAFNGWEGPILTDSGGFQVFSLAKIRTITEEGVTFKEPKTGDKVFITPEKSMHIQLSLGSDIIMAFDDLTGLGAEDIGRTEEAMERTHRWLQRCIAEFRSLTKGLPTNKKPLLFGIVQGGLDKKLRQKSLEFVQAQDIDGVAIGGLSVGESREEMHGMLEFLARLYDPSKVRYLMGVGDPIDMKFAIEHGIDMFDCVLPTRNARHGSVWIGDDQKINLKNAEFSSDKLPIEVNCDCFTCKTGYSRAFLRHLYKSDNPLAGSLASIHNLRFLARTCESYR